MNRKAVKPIELIRQSDKPFLKIWRINKIGRYGFWLVGNNTINEIKRFDTQKTIQAKV